MEFKNTKPTAADFFRKYADIVSEAEKEEESKEVKKDDSKKKEDKKDKKTLKETSSPTTWEKMMGITPQQLQEKYEGFAAVKKSVAKNPKVKDPGAVAASIGRTKYGKGTFQKMAAAGKKEESCSMEESASPSAKKVTNQGRLAAIAGKGSDSNPYKKDTQHGLHLQWKAGHKTGSDAKKSKEE